MASGGLWGLAACDEAACALAEGATRNSHSAYEHSLFRRYRKSEGLTGIRGMDIEMKQEAILRHRCRSCRKLSLGRSEAAELF